MRNHRRLLLGLLLAVTLPLATCSKGESSRPAAAPQGAPVAATVVYVGTYTDAGSRGVYRVRLDPAKGRASLGAPVLAGQTENPSFLALHPDGRVLYAANEVDRFGGRPTGAVSAFAIDAKTGDLTLLDQQPSEGGGPCHLSVDHEGKNLLVANYGGGTVAVLPIDADGRLRPASSVQRHQGSGPNRERQEKPHAHGIYLDHAERFALATDLGADRVFVYAFDPQAGTLKPHGAASLPPGSGPRHLVFDPAGTHVYVIDELSNDIIAFAYDPNAGALHALQRVSTVPAGAAAGNSTAEIAISKDGLHLYGSNRGRDTLAVFAVDPASGRLTPQGEVAAGGRTPRHFALDPSGRLLLVAHQDSDSLSLFGVEASGMPAPSGATATVSRPVCVLFAPAR
ncbi:MAG TPA: lactonase family protein [Vicinamibacteria bacterium]|nr:lactonase family protein [Vicinamibacteria bacterium]